MNEKEKKITIDVSNNQATMSYTNCNPFEVLGALKFFEKHVIVELSKTKVKKNKTVKTKIQTP